MTAPDPTPARSPLPLAAPIYSAVWLIAVVLSASDAGLGIGAFVLLFYAAIFWGLAWLIRLGLWVFHVRRGRRPPMPAAKARLYWGMEPAVFVLSLVLVFSGALQQTRFYLSYAALQDYAEEVRAGKMPEQQHSDAARRVGLYSISETECLEDGGVRFITSANGFDDAGFAYAPAGQPPRIGEDSYHRIGGRWWFWYRSW